MKYTIIKTDMFTHKIPTKELRMMVERDRTDVQSNTKRKIQRKKNRSKRSSKSDV
jgi:hypothetical protein